MEKTVFEMTQQELIELNSQYLKRIQELEQENAKLRRSMASGLDITQPK